MDPQHWLNVNQTAAVLVTAGWQMAKRGCDCQTILLQAMFELIFHGMEGAL
jgi:hypothetical protein